MASALAAFAYGLGTKEQETRKDKGDDDAQVVGSDDEDDDIAHHETHEAARPKSLADVAQMSNSKPAKLAVSLADFALQQKTQSHQPAALSLLQVAQQENQETRQKSCQQLSVIAAQLSKEDAELAKRRGEKIQSALQTTSEEVRAQMQAKQRQAVEQAVQQAIVEEQQYQQDDEFQDEDDQAIHQAANLLIAKANAASANGNNSTKPPVNEKESAKLLVLTLSVDRHVLKQRQNRHGQQSKSTSKAKTMKDKLSSFQFHQLSITQRRLFLATLVGDDDADGNDNAAMKKDKKIKYNKDAINELAKDKAKLQQQKYKQHKKPEFAKLDDNRNCRFKPRFFTGGQQSEKKGKQNGSEDDEDSSNNANQRSEDFVRRMEAAERAKNEQLRRTREEMAYLARVDKKECPMCGNPQSYSELSQKRKKCPNCGVTYKNRVAWSDIANQFLERMEQFLEMKDEARRKREMEQQLQVIGHSRHRRYHHQRRSSAGLGYGNNNNADAGGETKTWEEVQDEFIGRVQLDLMHRALSKDAILHKLQKECSFTPSISNKAKRLDLGTFDERLRRDLENRKARQEQYRILAGAIAKASGVAGREGDVRETRLANKSKRLQGLPPPANFQERLRLDLEKRREREQDNNFDEKQRARRPTQTQIKW